MWVGTRCLFLQDLVPLKFKICIIRPYKLRLKQWCCLLIQDISPFDYVGCIYYMYRRNLTSWPVTTLFLHSPRCGLPTHCSMQWSVIAVIFVWDFRKLQACCEIKRAREKIILVLIWDEVNILSSFHLLYQLCVLGALVVIRDCSVVVLIPSTYGFVRFPRSTSGFVRCILPWICP